MRAMGSRACTKCQKKRQERFFSTPRARVCDTCKKAVRKSAGRRSHVSRTYGLSAEDHAALLEYQGGVCAICDGKRKVLDVDHDHSKEGRKAVRGLLCARCNRRLLPACLNNVHILLKAVDYLDCPPAVWALS
jgi:tRNA(Ile)-lysidine synthase TilS/MesJ